MKEVLSNNINKIEISGIRRFFNKVELVPEAVSLTLGQPDFSVPENIKKAMIDAVNENKTTYTSNAGIIELRKEITKYLKGFSIEYSPNEICLTIGGSEALMDVFAALLNTGDKVLIPTPAYPAYESCTNVLGGKPVFYNLKQDFSIDIDLLDNIIKTEKPKILVLSYPSNPTGAVLSKEIRNKLYEVVRNNDIVVVSDEIYSSICFENEYYSIAQYKDIKDKVILVSGFSKMFSMTGLRLGFVCAVDSYMKGIMKMHQYNVSCAPSIAQWGAYEGLRSCLSDVEAMKKEFMKRRDYVFNRLKAMGFEVNLPQGAFYIFPKIDIFKMNSEYFCERLLNEGKVAMVPGSAFGTGGEGYMRISYSYSMQQLKEGLDRLENYLKNKI
ncbi:MAG: aminotransferase class I/II-fold pyridoxal phosphate-dependent enzyme [Bacillota bacterium]|nr:aminotransferase class I/II-fold pyridoxal phosphate-dependent enzyme [Bacillota bacterium]